MWLPHAPTAGAVGGRTSMPGEPVRPMLEQYRNHPCYGCCKLLQPGRAGPTAGSGRSHSMLKLLVVTNDFPPRIGGIEEYVAELVRHLSSDISATVLTSRHPDAAPFDRSFPSRVIRWAPYPLLPTPRLVQAVVEQVSHDQVDVLAFGATLPLAFIAGAVRRRTDVPVVMVTHGVEPALTSLPGGPAVLRRLARHATIMTVLSQLGRAANPIGCRFNSANRVVAKWGGRRPVSAKPERRIDPPALRSWVRARHCQRRQAGPKERDTIG